MKKYRFLSVIRDPGLASIMNTCCHKLLMLSNLENNWMKNSEDSEDQLRPLAEFNLAAREMFGIQLFLDWPKT